MHKVFFLHDLFSTLVYYIISNNTAFHPFFPSFFCLGERGVGCSFSFAIEVSSYYKLNVTSIALPFPHLAHVLHSTKVVCLSSSKFFFLKLLRNGEFNNLNIILTLPLICGLIIPLDKRSPTCEIF